MQGTKNRSTYLQQPPRPRGLCSNAEKPDVAFLKKKYIRPPALRRKRIWDLLLAGIGSRTRKRPLPPVLALLCEGISSEFGISRSSSAFEITESAPLKFGFVVFNHPRDDR